MSISPFIQYRPSDQQIIAGSMAGSSETPTPAPAPALAASVSPSGADTVKIIGHTRPSNFFVRAT